MSDLLTTVRASCREALVAVKDVSHRAPGSPTTQALLVGALVGFLAYKATQKRYRLPPGPFALPLLGNVLSMAGAKEAFYVKLRRWAKEKYGPVITVYLGPVLCVFLNDTDVATEALVKKGEDFAGRPFLHSMDVFSEGSKSIVFADYSPAWKLQRKIAMQALRHYMSGKYLEKVVHQVMDMVCDEMAAEPGAFDPHLYNSSLMFNIIATICFGEVKAYGDLELNGIREMFDKFNSEFGNGVFEDVFPPLRYWPTKRYTRIMGYLQGILDYLYKNIDQHRASFSPDNIRDLTDSILLAQSEAAREESAEVMAMLTDQHVGQTIADMFGAGVDSSRLTLDWALLYMAGHPDIQKRAQEEIDSVTGSRMPETGDRHKLPFTQAVLFETLRLGVVLPTAVPHKTLCDTTVGGYDVPKDTMVFVNQWAILHDPKKWDQPEEFRPKRFLDDQGNLKKIDCWTPFSAGRRACLGETVAKPELLLILACLLKRFTISLPEGAVYDPEYNVETGITIHAPKPYKVVVHKR
ncbi:steroid 17-alpha-hydroxylase/17,20 lyase-like [Littorina saxatilis]|uniref:Steroid 21-hydroxylase n=1 Tax=Littorina saxatilis TaxID=31220 RepID=A0AAN9ANA9_9CAEN